MCRGRASSWCLSSDIFLAGFPKHRAAGPHDATTFPVGPSFLDQGLCWLSNKTSFRALNGIKCHPGLVGSLEG